MARDGSISQFLAEVGRRHGFSDMDRQTLARFAEYFVRDEVDRDAKATLTPDDVWILGTANAQVTLYDARAESSEGWVQATILRGGAAVSAGPLSTEFFGPDLPCLREEIEFTRSGSVWRMTPAGLKHFRKGGRVRSRNGQIRAAVDPLRWAPGSMQEWLRAFVILPWINRSADLQLLTPPQRLALARTAEIVRSPAPGASITRAGERAEVLTLLGPGMTATATQGKGEPVVVLTGALFGWSAFSGGRATTDAEVRTPGFMFTWREPSLVRRALGLGPLAHPWMSRFCQERDRVYRHATSIIQGLRRLALLRDVKPHRIAPLLQGATAVTWRVGAPPPVPVGLHSGLCVITEGEVVTYQMLPDEHAGSITMVRIEPVQAHRGGRPDDPPDMHQLDTVGEFEVADRLSDLAAPPEHPHLLGEHLTALASNRWTARVPSRGVFIPTWRLRRILGEGLQSGVARVQQRVQLEAAVREQMRRLDASNGSFRDDLNLVWVTRGDGSPPQPVDTDLLAEVADFIAQPGDRRGFEERSLLVELVPAGDGREPGTWEPHTSRSSMVEIGTLATDRERGLADLVALIRERNATANVFAWASSDAFGHRIKAAADTVLLMNHDPTMRLAGWPEANTPIQVANLVRSARNTTQPPVTIRLHGLLEPDTPDEGFAGRRTLLGRWARALTHRRVGVALGGGGAWGWAHVALLEAMESHRVPLDILSGASFGSIAGGLYALGGLPGLQWALQNDGRLQFATNGSMVLGWPMARLLDGLIADLEKWAYTLNSPLSENQAHQYRRNLRALMVPGSDATAIQLTHLPLPFFPVSTELVTGSEAPLLSGTVGDGVKASGSLPPFFPTSRTQHATFADGGLSRNVPANVLLLEGAAVVVGSNIVPPPFIREPSPESTSRIRRTAGALNPFRRSIESIVGVQTLFNQAGAVNTGLAPIVFQSEWNGNMFFQIARGEDIVEDTRGERAFWQAMGGLATRWEATARPRRGIGPVASTSGAAQGGQEPVPT